MYPVPSRWSLYQKNKNSGKPQWGQVNSNDNEKYASVDETDEESNTEGFNVASIMSYATADHEVNEDKADTNTASDDEEANDTTNDEVSTKYSYSPPSLSTYQHHGGVQIHSFGKELTTTTSR